MKIIIAYNSWDDCNRQSERVIGIEYPSIELLNTDMVADNIQYEESTRLYSKSESNYSQCLYEKECRIHSETRNLNNVLKKLKEISMTPYEKRPENYEKIVNSLNESIVKINAKLVILKTEDIGRPPLIKPIKKFNFSHWYSNDLSDLKFYTLDEWFLSNRVDI